MNGLSVNSKLANGLDGVEFGVNFYPILPSLTLPAPMLHIIYTPTKLFQSYTFSMIMMILNILIFQYIYKHNSI